MLRITELRLPLDHAEDALRPAIVARLGVRDAELRAFSVFKRSYDARKRSAIVLIYTIDCDLAVDESAVLARFAGDAHVRVTPDTNYKFVGQAGPGIVRDSERPEGDTAPVVFGLSSHVRMNRASSSQRRPGGVLLFRVRLTPKGGLFNAKALSTAPEEPGGHRAETAPDRGAPALQLAPLSGDASARRSRVSGSTGRRSP